MPESNKTQQAIWLGLGSLSSFFLTIVSSVILTKYFNINDYGTYRQVLYVYNTLLVIFTLGIPRAYSYFLPRTELIHSRDVIKKIRNLFFILGGIFSLSLLVFSELIADVLKNADLGLALRVFSPVPLLLLPTMGMESILATYHKSKLAAIYTIANRILMLLLIVLPVLAFGSGYIYAIVGFVVASFLSFILASKLMFLPLKGVNSEKSNLSYREILVYCFPLFTASIWGVFLRSADQFFISRYFGAETFAVFSNGAIELPFVTMIIASTSTVITPYFSRLIHENSSDLRNQILKTWLSILEKSVKLIYPLLFFFIFFSKEVILILFDERYLDSATFFQIKTAGNLLTIVSYLGLIMAINANRLYSQVHFYSTLVMVLLQFGFIYLVESPYVIVLISILCKSAITLIMVGFIARYFKIPFRRSMPFKLMLKISIPSALFLYVLHLVLEGLSPFLVISLGFISYASFMIAYVRLAKLDYQFLAQSILDFKSKIV